jgi:hypothetical protein
VTDAARQRRRLLSGLLHDGAVLAAVFAAGFGLDMWIETSFSSGLIADALIVAALLMAYPSLRVLESP